MAILFMDSFEGFDESVTEGTATRSSLYGANMASVPYLYRTGARSLGPYNPRYYPIGDIRNLTVINPRVFTRFPCPAYATPSGSKPGRKSLGIAGAIYPNNKQLNEYTTPIFTVNVDTTTGGRIETFRYAVFLNDMFQACLGVADRKLFFGGGVWAIEHNTHALIPPLKWSHIALYASIAVGEIGHSKKRHIYPDGSAPFEESYGIYDMVGTLSLWVNGEFVETKSLTAGYHNVQGVWENELESINHYVVSEDMGSAYGNMGVTSFVLDDFYLFDNPGDVVDLPIDIIRPNGSTSFSGWTPSDPTKENWELVDDATSDTDISLVMSDTVNQLDMYEFEDTNLEHDAEIIAVQITQITKKTSNSVAKTCTVWDPGGTGTRYNDTPVVLNDNSYLYFQRTHTVNPVTGLPWTVDELDNIQAGILRVE